MKIGDMVWLNAGFNGYPQIGRVFGANESIREKTIYYDVALGNVRVSRRLDEITLATDEEVMLWQLENA